MCSDLWSCKQVHFKVPDGKMEEKHNANENILIIANPGTGKTTALAKRVVELLRAGAKESEILCITFTNKAAQEMRQRIDKEIAEAGIEAKPYLIEVHTFHSYAYDFLKKIGIDAELASNNMLRYSIYKSFIEDRAFNYPKSYILDELVPKTENAIRYVKSFGILPKDIDMEKASKELECAYEEHPLSNVTLEEALAFLRYFVNAYQRYEKEKENSRSYIDYNDMLIKFVQMHDGKKRYKYVLVDELQDLNELEALSSNRKDGTAEVRIITAQEQINAAVKLYSGMKTSGNEKTAIITRTNGQLVKLSRLLDKKGIEYSTTAGSSTSGRAKEQIISYLKGMLYSDRDSIVGALFTPFAGITLREAFKISEEWKIPKHDEKTEIPNGVLRIAKPFFERRQALTIDKMGSLFDEVILPISMQIGKDYYLTAKAMASSAAEFFELVQDRSAESFFDYLSILEEDYEPPKEEKNLVLTTVHKAKGREFNNVIYVPVSGKKNESFADMAVYSIIKSSTGIDVREELEEEQARVDFVAFTRAKNRLYIIANQRNSDSYKVEGFESEALELEDEIEPIGSKGYDEAYSLFINGRYDEAKSIVKKNDPWLFSLIESYFSSDKDISYSTIEGLANPYLFMKERILGVAQQGNEAMNRGSRVHEIAEKLYKGTLDEGKLNEEEKAYLENIKKINKELNEKMHARQIAAEMEIRVGLKDICKKFDESLGFKAVLDAVYETDESKYVILDYKTDRTDAKAAEHRRQLAVYKKALAASKGISENDISIAIGFVGIKGNINTGKLDCMLDLTQEKGQQISTFEKHLERFLSYKRNPELFVEDLLASKNDEPLYGNIARQLKEILTSRH